MKEHKRPAVAFSGGNCSLAVLHMACQIDPNVRVVFCDTTIEYPETYAFVKKLWDEWNLNLSWVKPEKTWAECIEQYGLPSFRAKRIKGKRKKGSNVPRCCYWLKEKPAKLYYQKHKIDCAIDGIRQDESYQRFCFGRRYGPLHYSKTWGMWKAHPVLHWIEQDVWLYINQNDIPYNPMYDKGLKRLGCRGCTGHKNWQWELANFSPKMYKWIQEEKLGQKLLKVDGETEISKNRATASSALPTD